MISGINVNRGIHVGAGAMFGPGLGRGAGFTTGGATGTVPGVPVPVPPPPHLSLYSCRRRSKISTCWRMICRWPSMLCLNGPVAFNGSFNSLSCTFWARYLMSLRILLIFRAPGNRYLRRIPSSFLVACRHRTSSAYCRRHRWPAGQLRHR
jgi:hypothetical protein